MNSPNPMRLAAAWTLSLITALFGCAAADPEQRPDDPLQYSKKLVTQGHLSLYENGAFHVPNTSISLIPPGPSAAEFALELMGIRARQSLLLSLKRARESVSIVSEGTKISLQAGTAIHDASGELTREIQRFTRADATLLIYHAAHEGKELLGKAWEFSKETTADMDRLGTNLVEDSRQAGREIAHGGSEQGRTIVTESLAQARNLSRLSRERSSAAGSFARQEFVQGYATVPSKLKTRGQEMGDDLAKLEFSGSLSQENERRGRWTKTMTELIGRTVTEYPSNVNQSMSKAKQELADSHTTGISLAVLRSLRWVVQGLLWDAAIEPVGKLSAASLGYVGVNAVAFPVMVVAREAGVSTELALEIGWDSSKAGYDLIAPSGKAAVAGLFSLVDLTGSHLAAGSLATAGSAAGYGIKATSQVAGAVVKGTGYAAGKTVQYIGVPLAAAGIVVGGGTIGVATGTAQVLTGGSLLVAGELGAATTYTFGNVIAGSTIAAGTAASVGVAGGYAFYELNKAVAVPAGYELGGGLVLSYGTLSHLGAHTILAASDFSYLVLSLEGPRWVIYAVRGKLDKGEHLVPGTMLNLKTMREAGEEIYNIPVSDAEMSAVVNSIYEELPEVE